MLDFVMVDDEVWVYCNGCVYKIYFSEVYIREVFEFFCVFLNDLGDNVVFSIFCGIKIFD